MFEGQLIKRDHRLERKKYQFEREQGGFYESLFMKEREGETDLIIF